MPGYLPISEDLSDGQLPIRGYCSNVSRYDLGAPGDEQFEPGSEGKVLRNKKGLTQADEVDRVEASLLALAQNRSFFQIETQTQLSVELICSLHRSWLETLYEFAGEIRTIDLAKEFVTFAPAAYLRDTLRELDSVLSQNTPCEGFELSRLVSAISQVHAELLLAHPFREGNGRLSRWIADLMALQAGYPPLEWGFDWQPDARRERYFAALRRGFLRDYQPLEALVREALDRATRSKADPHVEP